MLLPLRRAMTELRHSCRRDLNPRPPNRQSGRRSTEVTDIFTTALPMRCIDNQAARWGTGDIGVSDAQRRFFPKRKNRKPATQRPAGPLPRYVNVKGGIRTRLCHVAKDPKSSPPASVEPQDAAEPNYEQNSAAALNDAPPSRTPEGSLCHRYPARASFPPTGPARLSPRHCGASPGIRVSRSGLRREIF
jgi:hypothetical protein